MIHLNDSAVYKPLDEDIPPILKESIMNKLKLLRNNSFLKQTLFEYYKPSKQTHTHPQKPDGHNAYCIQLQ